MLKKCIYSIEQIEEYVIFFPFLIVHDPRWNLCGILVARSGSWKVIRKEQKNM